MKKKILQKHDQIETKNKCTKKLFLLKNKTKPFENLKYCK